MLLQVIDNGLVLFDNMVEQKNAHRNLMDRDQEKIPESATIFPHGLEEVNKELTGSNERLSGEIILGDKSRETLPNQVHFERLLSDIAARFVNVHAEQIENEIENSQRRICEFL